MRLIGRLGAFLFFERLGGWSEKCNGQERKKNEKEKGGKTKKKNKEKKFPPCTPFKEKENNKRKRNTPKR